MINVARRGLMLVLSSPSGAGKSTVAKALLANDPQIAMSVSATTRPPRSGEVDGVDYHFLSMDRFQSMRDQGEFLEHAQVFGNCYGTPKAPVAAALESGRDVLFDIDWQGTQQLGRTAGSDLVKVFILPPSVKELESRLHTRAQDSDAVVKARMSKASDEMSHWAEYDYIVINQNAADAIAEVQAILKAERLRRDRRVGMAEFVNQLREV